ncbi:MAG: hypothetical protein KUG73_13900 [Pseudomonadales bacterium]|nr:hypothetical protein [Pseudomonadales bacterium]
MSYRVRVVLCWTWLIGFCLVGSDVYAGDVQFDVVLQSDTRSLSIGTSLEYLEDESGGYSLDEVREPGLSDRWIKSVKEVPSFGFTSSAYWFRFTLANSSNERFSGLLELGYPLLDFVDVYLLSAANEKKAMPDYLFGDSKAFDQRVIPHRNFLVPLVMPAHESSYVYIRVETGSATQLPIVIWEDQAFYQADADWLMLQGVFYGIMLIMALYNLFVFVAIRDVSYFFYVCYVVGFAGVMASIQGLGFQYIWADSLLLQDRAPVYSILFATLAVVVFTGKFLHIEQRSERLHKAGTLIVMSIVAASFLAFYCRILFLFVLQ